MKYNNNNNYCIIYLIINITMALITAVDPLGVANPLLKTLVLVLMDCQYHST